MRVVLGVVFFFLSAHAFAFSKGYGFIDLRVLNVPFDHLEVFFPMQDIGALFRYTLYQRLIGLDPEIQKITPKKIFENLYFDIQYNPETSWKLFIHLKKLSKGFTSKQIIEKKHSLLALDEGFTTEMPVQSKQPEQKKLQDVLEENKVQISIDDLQQVIYQLLLQAYFKESLGNEISQVLVQIDSELYAEQNLSKILAELELKKDGLEKELKLKRALIHKMQKALIQKANLEDELIALTEEKNELSKEVAALEEQRKQLDAVKREHAQFQQGIEQMKASIREMSQSIGAALNIEPSRLNAAPMTNDYAIRNHKNLSKLHEKLMSLLYQPIQVVLSKADEESPLGLVVTLNTKVLDYSPGIVTSTLRIKSILSVQSPYQKAKKFQKELVFIYRLGGWHLDASCTLEYRELIESVSVYIEFFAAEAGEKKLQTTIKKLTFTEPLHLLPPEFQSGVLHCRDLLASSSDEIDLVTE